MKNQETFVDTSFEKSLEEAMDRVPGLLGLVIADSNGLPVSSSFSEDGGVLSASAMSAVAVDAAIRIAKHLEVGEFENVTFAFREYYLLVATLADRKANLLALAEKDVNLGLLHLALEEVRKTIEGFLEDFVQI
ncbi:MAG: roadblock/LC7 domain-containing protein [Thermoplasmata archaeon]